MYMSIEQPNFKTKKESKEGRKDRHNDTINKLSKETGLELSLTDTFLRTPFEAHGLKVGDERVGEVNDRRSSKLGLGKVKLSSKDVRRLVADVLAGEGKIDLEKYSEIQKTKLDKVSLDGNLDGVRIDKEKALIYKKNEKGKEIPVFGFDNQAKEVELTEKGGRVKMDVIHDLEDKNNNRSKSTYLLDQDMYIVRKKEVLLPKPKEEEEFTYAFD